MKKILKKVPPINFIAIGLFIFNMNFSLVTINIFMSLVGGFLLLYGEKDLKGLSKKFNCILPFAILKTVFSILIAVLEPAIISGNDWMQAISIVINASISLVILACTIEGFKELALKKSNKETEHNLIEIAHLHIIIYIFELLMLVEVFLTSSSAILPSVFSFIEFVPDFVYLYLMLTASSSVEAVT